MEGETHHDEQKLVEMLMNHDEAAFAYLYDNYHHSLYTIVKTFIRDEDSANDALQDIFVNIFRKIDTYDSSKGRLYTWMSSIARNLCIDIVKSKGFRNDQRKVDMSEALHLPVPQGIPGFEKIALIKSFVKLKTKYWEVLELSYFKGYSQNEIAQILDLPVGTVKTRIKSALLQLRPMLE